MSRKKPFSDFDDDGVNPLGKKQPIAFLAPTLKLMAPGSHIDISKTFTEARVKAAACRAGARVDVRVLPDRLQVTLISKINRW